MSEPDCSAPAAAASRPPSDRLDSWKEIAAYLRRDIRTVQRWEKLEGLPVHRHVHQQRGSAFAYRPEIDAWWASRGHDLQQANLSRQPLDRRDAEGDDPDRARVTADEANAESGNASRRTRQPAVWITGAAGVLTLLGFSLWRSGQPPSPFVTGHQLLSDFPGGSGGASFSPDGSMVAFHHAELDDVGPIGSL